MIIDRRERFFAIALAAARTGLCAYRAAHQSITIDEAYTFNHYVGGAWSDLFAQPYFTNNHILYSILAKLAVAAFGNAEWALRLPSVIAGFFLVLGVFAVLRISVSRTVCWVATIAIALQPLLLDFSVAARGYGLGIALLIWAMYFAMRDRWVVSGTLLGFAIAAQLSMAPAALGLLAGLALLGRPVRNLAKITIPAAAVALLICAPVMRSGMDAAIHIGYPTIGESVFSMVFPGDTDRAGRFIHAHTPAAIAEISVVALIGLFIAGATGAALLRNRGMRLLPGVAFLCACSGFVIAHFLFGADYPVDRTGLPLILLFGIAWAIAADSSPRLVGANIPLAVLFSIQFLAQFDTHTMRVWKFDRNTRHVAELIRDESSSRPPASVSISTVWINLQALEYYRRTLPIPALRPIEFHDPPPVTGFDFYVLNTADDPRIDPAMTRVIHVDPASGILLAKASGNQ